YVATATLTAGGSPVSRPVDKTWLTNGDLSSGRTLSYTLSPTPTSWATGAGSAPPSLTSS
ncbi:MAG TPA: hypothetical protein VKJ07_24945, partial [Mycobacteriales bacterium]|nr:hypothetical protein [Mycobacteriales bacterium]